MRSTPNGEYMRTHPVDNAPSSSAWEITSSADIPRPPASEAPAQILVVDADARLKGALVELLRHRGYQVDDAGSGRDATAQLGARRYDLMILEVALPDESGIAVMRKARETQPDLMIIVQTAQPSAESAIAAVKMGAADYLVKPFNPNDVIMAVSRYLRERAEHMRRLSLLAMVSETMKVLSHFDRPDADHAAAAAIASTPAPSSRLRQTGPLTLDHEKRMAVIDGDPPITAELTEGEVAVLTALMEQPDRVLSCDHLAKTLGYHNVDRWTAESVVRSCVFRLRQKIEPTPDSPRLLRTVRGRGYFLRPPDDDSEAQHDRHSPRDLSRDGNTLTGILPS